MPLTDFFRGPGRTSLDAGDIVTSITFPVPPKNSAGSYVKVGRNSIGDLAIVGVTAYAYPDPAKPSGVCFRVVLASVAPVPFVAVKAGEILEQGPINAAAIDRAAQAAMDACAPIDDVRGSARYRKFMVRNMTSRAITKVWDEIQAQ